MSEFVRVRPASMGGPCAVRHPEHGQMVVPRPAEMFSADDPLVKAYPWLFVTDEQAAEAATAEPVTSVVIEQATKAPGERRRGTRRTTGKSR